jgi:anaerobic ribonucleoside-triphosphate reductase activating protein
MRLAEVLDSSQIYGPGQRTVVWLQGCSIRCPNCWNDELWSFKGGYVEPHTNLIDRAISNNDVGLTLLGGEPLDQATTVLKFIKDAQASGLDIVLYTGYELDELSEIQQACVRLADLVIHGRYIDELRNEHLLWRGSTNQEILINNPKYEGLEIIERRQMEIHIDSFGHLKIVGYPPTSIVESITARNGSIRSLKQQGD